MSEETPLSVVIQNNTSKTFATSGWDLSLSYQTAKQVADGGMSCTGIGQNLEVGKSIKLQLPEKAESFGSFGMDAKKEAEDLTIVRWALEVRRKGVLFAENGAEPGKHDPEKLEMSLVPGNTYTLIEDDANPPLTEEGSAMVVSLILEALEKNVGYSNVWAFVLENLPVKVKGHRTVEELRKVFELGSIPAWEKEYKPFLPEDGVSSEEIAKELRPFGKAKIQVYYRALGRFPGGNADMHTVLFDLSCSDMRCSIRDYANWDGTQCHEEFVPPKLEAFLPEKLPIVCDVIKEAVAESLVNSECSLIDTAMDSDEYDSEWTSQEVLVFLPRVWSKKSHKHFSQPVKDQVFAFLMVSSKLEPKIPKDVMGNIFNYLSNEDCCVFRLHRFVVPNPNAYSWAKKENPRPDVGLGSPLQLKVLSTVDKTLGMGRVNQWSDAGDDEEPCPATKDRPEKTNSVECPWTLHLPYCQPIFLRWPSSIYKK